MKISLVTFIIIIIFISSEILTPQSSYLRYEDRIRISEALRISEIYGNKIWEEWPETPFAVLLVTDEKEFLINHPEPSDDFELAGYDSLLESEIYSRARIFDTNLLAAFPAVNGLPTVVIGTPENTGSSSSEWVIHLLHENFHQLQMNDSSYYKEIKELGLSNGDQTGMWMLNYPFPYNDEKVNSQYNILRETLLNLLKPFPPDSRLFNRNFSSFLEEREKFKNLLNEKDYKYFSFQLWQEGIARYTEYKLTDMIAHYEPNEDFEDLDDYTPFYKIADELRENIFDQVRDWELKEKQRLCFYSYGAAEGLLLDRINKKWKEKYFTDKFFLEEYFIP